MKLSILICSLEKRSHLLARLMAILDMQQCNGVEILVNTDNGQLKIADKRNLLLNAAKGEYVCFIDDDDLVPNYYVSEILKAIETKPDVIGFKGYMTTNGLKREDFAISTKYKSWYVENGVHYRCPNHLSPVKKEFALKVMFEKGKQSGEDAIYSLALLPLLNTEVFIDKDMYHYDFNTTTSTQGK